MRQPVTISKGGKSQKVEFLEALLYTVSRDLPKASLSERLRFLRDLDKLGLTGILADQAKLDQERAEVEADRRYVERSRYQDKLLREASCGNEAVLQAKWYAVVSVLSEIRDLIEWGEGTERLADKVEVICRAFEHERELDAQVDKLIEHLRDFGSTDEDEDGEDADHDDDDRYGDNFHDPSTDGAVDCEPGAFDETSVSATHDPNDPALDLNNTHIFTELNPPAGDVEGED